MQNPVGLEGSGELLARLSEIVMWTLFGVTLLGLVALVVRWRRAWGVERRQLAWPLLGVVLSLALIAVSVGATVVGANEAVIGSLVAVALGVFPVSIAVAVLREGLLDIELVLRRTLIYTILSAVIVGSYVLALTLASRWFATSSDVAVSILATVLVVLGLSSLKTRLERWVSRALFGRRDRPQAVLAALAACGERHLDGTRLLRELESQLGTAMRLPFVAIRRDAEHRLPAPVRPGSEVFPLVHAGVELGHLEVARRTPSEPLTTEEVRTLESAALQIAGLVRSAGLDTELRAARANLVRSREQERLRIRRDLHDGLGPVLAATTLQVDALRRRLDEHDTDGQQIADRVSAQLQSAVTDVRGLIEGLRPPVLDQMGLASSIEELVTPLRDAGVAVDLDVGVPDALDPATEVAAYRIAAEALTNVLRHSTATRCGVSAQVDRSSLLLEVTDDGSGLSGRGHAGVGLASMAERAAELGGTLTISRVEPRGTRVSAVLPMEES
ncbi:MAG: histidine kinase [Marmoricola sp.]